jgi:hypothetical protein
MGLDAVNLILIVPLLLIGGTLLMLRRDSAKYFLILTPVTLFSLAFEAGVGEEWSLYTGNAEHYAWLFIVEIIVAMILLVGTLPMFSKNDVPQFRRRGLKVYVGFVTLLLVVFAAMWIQELVQVSTTGNTTSGSYTGSPAAFWMVRFMDLGITIPLGFLGMYLLLTRPERAYSLVLLFFGFFVTMGTSVTSMGIVMAVNHDPQAQAGGPRNLSIVDHNGLVRADLSGQRQTPMVPSWAGDQSSDNATDRGAVRTKMKITGEKLQITKARPILLRTVVGLEIFGALGGFAGGIPFLLDPSGKILGSLVSVLKGTPISDYFLVGLWLTGIFGVGGLLVASLVWTSRAFARPLGYLLGSAAVFWVTIENIVFGPSLVLALVEAVFCGPQIASAILLFSRNRQ